MTNLDKLIEAVEAGEAIAAQSFGDELGIEAGLYANHAYNGLSLDAALALKEAVLPGWAWLARATDDEDDAVNRGKFLANIWEPDRNPNNGQPCFPVWADTPARALLLAILKALKEKEDG